MGFARVIVARKSVVVELELMYMNVCTTCTVHTHTFMSCMCYTHTHTGVHVIHAYIVKYNLYMYYRHSKL